MSATGKKLYEAARAGEEIERLPRPVLVSEFEVWREGAASRDVHFRVRCSKGTYIRSLVHDLVRLTRYLCKFNWKFLPMRC